MFNIGLIVFRETLEAALFIGIIAAATRHIPRRNHWIILGILMGVIGAIGIALGIGIINDLADGTGQDWLHIIILSSAFLMLIWHILFASNHALELAQKAKQLGNALQLRKTSLIAITIAIALMVLREGTETVLFISGTLSSAEHNTQPIQSTTPSTLLANHTSELPQTLDLTNPNQNSQTKSQLSNPQLADTLDLTQGYQHTPASTPAMASSNTEANFSINTTTPTKEQPTEQTESNHTAPTNTNILIGVITGLTLGILSGAILYFGLARIPVKQVFNLTNGLVILIAAGMAGQIGKRLAQMGHITDNGEPLWNSQSLLPDEHPIGITLNALMGYETQPTWTHVTFFLLALIGIPIIRHIYSKKNPRPNNNHKLHSTQMMQ